jgi:hypothetical protein
MEPVETILVPISKAAGCTIICEAELSHDCTCRQTARAVIETLDDAGLVVISRLALSFPYALLGADSQKEAAAVWTLNPETRKLSHAQFAASMGINLDPAAPTPSRTEEGDGW